MPFCNEEKHTSAQANLLSIAKLHPELVSAGKKGE